MRAASRSRPSAELPGAGVRGLEGGFSGLHELLTGRPAPAVPAVVAPAALLALPGAALPPLRCARGGGRAEGAMGCQACRGALPSLSRWLLNAASSKRQG